jgi:hypothetical protein
VISFLFTCSLSTSSLTCKSSTSASLPPQQIILHSVFIFILKANNRPTYLYVRVYAAGRLLFYLLHYLLPPCLLPFTFSTQTRMKANNCRTLNFRVNWASSLLSLPLFNSSSSSSPLHFLHRIPFSPWDGCFHHDPSLRYDLEHHRRSPPDMCFCWCPSPSRCHSLWLPLRGPPSFFLAVSSTYCQMHP